MKEELVLKPQLVPYWEPPIQLPRIVVVVMDVVLDVNSLLHIF